MINDPNEQIELRLDKFTFRFPKSLRYSEAGLWMRFEGILVRLGVSDFVQQRSGDVAFATLVPAGTTVGVGDELASIETVKVNVSLPSPVRGTIKEVNSMLQAAPELINQDPYGNGWIAVVQPEERALLLTETMDAKAYVELARQQAEAELTS